MDSNHDIVQTLRMFDGVMTGLAADEIEALRKRVAELEAAVVSPASIEEQRAALYWAIAQAAKDPKGAHWRSLMSLRKALFAEGSEEQAAAPESTGSLAFDYAHKLVAQRLGTSAKSQTIASTEKVYYGGGVDPEPVAFDESFQSRVKPWLLECFGPEIAADRTERNHRFLEEALELVQSCGCTMSEAHQLVDYVFNRPVGDPLQEAGGVMVTFAALCLANGIDMHAAGEKELARISAPEVTEKIRAKQAAKPKHSPLPEAPAQVPGMRDAAVRTMQHLGYTYNGGEMWRPPLGGRRFVPPPSDTSVRVCAVSDAECSRQCGDGACKEEIRLRQEK